MRFSQVITLFAAVFAVLGLMLGVVVLHDSSAAFLLTPLLCIVGLILFTAIANAPRLTEVFRQMQVDRAKLRLLNSKQAAQSHLIKREQQLEQQKQLMFEAALAGDQSVTLSMLHPEQAKSLRWLKRLASEHFSTMKQLRGSLGENTIDWHVELLRLIEQQQQQQAFELSLDRQQSIQFLNNHLSYLEQANARAA